MDSVKTCPCGHPKKYKDCCEKLISKAVVASTPEILMRSRYTAYSLCNYQYILDTYAKKSQQGLSVNDLRNSVKDTRWCKLEVIDTKVLPSEGFVEFAAYYIVSGKAFVMHERSRFVQEDHMWRYLSGEMLEKTGKLAIGRNEACLCGSGKKFKRCCNK